ncbi:MAG: Bug family tripartite tricarboxylate transporter substrate binding protein [Lautropia sp.]
MAQRSGKLSVLPDCHRPRRRKFVCVGMALGVASATGASADEPAPYPVRRVHMVVSYAAGNVTDLLARVIAEGLSARWGQPVTVENKPGQGGSLGAQAVARAAPDGYTLLFSAMAAMAINPHVYAKVGYDPLRDFVPIVNVAYPDLVMVASPQSGIRSLSQLVEFSKKNPTALNYGTAGNGTVPHLNMEAIKQRTGLQAQHVPYAAAGAVLTDLVGGRLQLQQESSAVLLPHIKSGKAVALAVAPKRLSELPDVPALGELIPGFEPVVAWLGLLAPAGTPPSVVDRINRDVRELLVQTAVKGRLAGYGLNVADGTPQEFAAQLRKDHERLGRLAQQLDIKVD